MGHPRSSLPPLRILVLHNNDFQQLGAERPDFASCADVENAARGVARALEARGHQAELYGVDGATLGELLSRIGRAPPDLVFNLCESLCGDARHEAVVPSLLELLGVPCTGSGSLALGLSLRKDRAKDLLRARAVPTPEAVTLGGRGLDGVALPPFPLIVKPTREDASVGISSASVVRDRAGLAQAVARVVDELDQPALVERYVEGRELYVSLLGNAPPRALPFHEIDFSAMPPELPRIVSYSGKWEASSVEFAGTRPTRCVLDEETRERVERAAQAAFEALGLADYGRVDVRLASDGTPFVIDVNPNCDLTDGAGFSRAAAYGGYDYPSLIEEVCRVALERHAREHRRPLAPAEAVPVVPLDASPQPSPHSDGGSSRARGRQVILAGGGGVRVRADRR
jgi:D-alanine-D-alanine ligase